LARLPEADPAYWLKTIQVPVQVNGKVARCCRRRLGWIRTGSRQRRGPALGYLRWTAEVRRVVVVPGRLVSFVV
jgi:hypothetical protein